MTVTGSGTVSSLTRSVAPVPFARIASTRECVIARMRPSSRPISRGVNPRFRMPRYRPCSGGSELRTVGTSAPMASLNASICSFVAPRISSISGRRSRKPSEEKISGRLKALSTSS